MRRVFEGVLEGTAPESTAVFMREVAELNRAVNAASQAVKLGMSRIANLEKALRRSGAEPGTLDSELEKLRQQLFEIDEALEGNRSMKAFGEPQVPTVAGRLRVASMTDGRSDYGPTATHRRALEIAAAAYAALEPQLRELLEVELPALERKMEDAGVPWTPGRPLPATGGVDED